MNFSQYLEKRKPLQESIAQIRQSLDDAIVLNESARDDMTYDDLCDHATTLWDEVGILTESTAPKLRAVCMEMNIDSSEFDAIMSKYKQYFT